MYKYLSLVLLVSNIGVIQCGRILAVFPTPSISHQVVFRPLMLELSRRGHDVTVMTTDPIYEKGKSPSNYTEIDVHDVSYEIWKDIMRMDVGAENNLFSQLELLLQLLSPLFETQLLNEEFQKIISDNRKFDLIIIEALTRPFMALTHIFKAPCVLMSSFGAVPGNYDIMGAPVHPILYPSSVSQRIYNPTLLDKIKKLYIQYKLYSLMYHYDDQYNALIKKVVGNDTPTVYELSNNIDMLILNMHPIWEGNYPVPPNVIHLWGLHKNPLKELPQDLKQFLDSSKHGVIYMSFGTNTSPSLMSPEKIQMFIRVFSKLPYDILWKWDKDELPGRTKNIRIGKWFPQTDILHHPKVKLFITQGGLQSTDESISAGVPLIGVPFLADQWFNVEKYVHHGIGLKIDFDSMTEDELKKAIDDVIRNQRYRDNIKKLKELMNDWPSTPLERGVWWIEYVIRHGGAKHLRSPSANISWKEYLNVDVIIVVLLGVSVLALLAVVIVKLGLKYFVITHKEKMS